MFDYILFDLDGTLTDPGEGITNSVAYALNAYGIEVGDKSALNTFIGPPLHESFQKYYNFSILQSFDAVTKYREYYHDRGIFENKVYDGVPEMLKALKDAKKTVIMATSKPTVFAERIAVHYGFRQYFDVIVGSELDGRRVDKAEVIEEALKQANVTDKVKCVMIGDRLHDIVGGKKNGLSTVGVLYGYGSYDELFEAGADTIVETVENLCSYLLD
ncbi:MAG: HAD family hydrolase [Clostridia bacterium]|nr:HAD family hydrolase [Clostridia bacterium]